jgi:hypothetical protein
MKLNWRAILPIFAVILVAVAVLVIGADPAHAGVCDRVDNNGDDWFWNTTLATGIYYYAMGCQDSGQNTCFSCDYLAYFTLSLSMFSEVTFKYFQGMFSSLLPVGLAIWIAVRISKLMMTGGEDGRTVIWSVIQRLALFSMIWIALGTTTGENRWAWRLVGPEFLQYSFNLSNDIRDNVVSNLPSGVTAGGTAVVCENKLSPVASSAFSGQDQSLIDFAAAANGTACTTERVHIIGIAAGFATMFSDNSKNDSSSWLPDFGYMAAVLITAIMGVFMVVVFGISMVWFTFLILDVVTRSLFTAAFLPVLGALYLFESTRGSAQKAITGLVGSIATAVVIGIVSVVSLILLGNVVTIYNSTYASVQPALFPDAVMTAISASNGDPFAQFLTRIQAIGDDPRIPMTLATPWFVYLLFSGVTSYALGKKILAMVMEVAGTSAASTFADKAVGLAKTGVQLGIPGGAVAALGMGKLGGMGLGSGAALGGAGFTAGGSALNAAGHTQAGAVAGGVGSVLSKLAGGGQKPNPFDGAPPASPNARSFGAEVMRKSAVSAVATTGQAAASAADD